MAIHADIHIKRIKEPVISFDFEELMYFSFFDINDNNKNIIEDSYVLSSDEKDYNTPGFL